MPIIAGLCLRVPGDRDAGDDRRVRVHHVEIRCGSQAAIDVEPNGNGFTTSATTGQPQKPILKDRD